MAAELEADEDELLLLADKVPSLIRRRIREQPDEFRRLAQLEQEALERRVRGIDTEPKKKTA
jgi:hypothetical protein